MNRRSFLKGGGIFAVVGAAVALVKIESQPVGSMVPCQGSHEPVEAYTKTAAIQISHAAAPEGTRTLVPCRKCGALFALLIPTTGYAGIHASGYKPVSTEIGSDIEFDLFRGKKDFGAAQDLSMPDPVTGKRQTLAWHMMQAEKVLT